MNDKFPSLFKNKNMAYLEPKNSSVANAEIRRVAFLLLENFSLMAFTGAVDALITTNLMRSKKIYEVLVVGCEEGATVSDLGIEVKNETSLSALDINASQIDMLIVCGGLRVRPISTALIRNKLRTASSKGVALGGLWNGAYFLAEAGLLNGYQCAYHPDGRAMMLEAFREVSVSTRSFIVDRNRLSCAGASSSLSMMLEVVRADCGNEVASAVEEMLSCDKGLDSPDISTISVDQNHALPEKLKTSLQLMKNNIEEPLSISEIARWVDISRRQLERLFCHYVSASPSRYYMELRLTRARQLLQQTNKTVVEIALATGFVSISHFHSCFSQLFNITPGQFRKYCQSQSY
ncbi:MULTISPECIES: GlxA family transcriptional regulator [Halomonadaceae]|uniref:HTH-type transcriptional regulator CdhR n=1 Tax=Vreelandella titanicae TaxID=664683 RepID=A0AAP9NP20_9GAMM|nr:MULTISPECIES: GlxA family transcriptional regulator [Halomonas]QKS25859.1 HTH-type transcriptional regulator CdhR [Halomonas titanicae]TMU28209.1 GlxA family transcriptional regulator [Halomonas sp. ATBC28]CDG52943.1 Transcriptional regulator, AraC family [Halomonas sp. A3H3]SDJ46103.1 Transcriptional regulator GlxA family, contains an amidase domain and an AraC-type DNA-binding HTH domain [Halomonas titanicae]